MTQSTFMIILSINSMSVKKILLYSEDLLALDLQLILPRIEILGR